MIMKKHSSVFLTLVLIKGRTWGRLIHEYGLLHGIVILERYNLCVL